MYYRTKKEREATVRIFIEEAMANVMARARICDGIFLSAEAFSRIREILGHDTRYSEDFTLSEILRIADHRAEPLKYNGVTPYLRTFKRRGQDYTFVQLRQEQLVSSM